MAYGNYFPGLPTPSYYPMGIPAPPQPQTPSQGTGGGNNGILWVQGEAGAKSYMVAPGQSVMLMDSETSTFYIKSSDASGMPMPLRIFDYKERTAPAPAAKVPAADYVTRQELEARLAEIVKGGVGDGKSTVPAAGRRSSAKSNDGDA